MNQKINGSHKMPARTSTATDVHLLTYTCNFRIFKLFSFRSILNIDLISLA